MQMFRIAAARLPMRVGRVYSTAAPIGLKAPEDLNEKEKHIYEKLATELTPTKLEVADVSGGCGSMYSLTIVSPKFAGISMVKQHRLVNQILKSEIAGWHGVQLKTSGA